MKMHKYDNLTLERVKELLWYNPDTGNFYWKVKKLQNKHKICAGAKTSKGYILISIDKNRCYAHRLAWFYVTGEWPKELIDHINNDPADNRWNNLRQATKVENARNSKVRKANKLGIKGISKNREGYLVRICLGTYSTIEEAISVYNKAIRRYYGEFAHLSKVA